MNISVCNLLINEKFVDYLPDNYLSQLIRSKSFLNRLQLNQFPSLKFYEEYVDFLRYLKGNNFYTEPPIIRELVDQGIEVLITYIP